MKNSEKNFVIFAWTQAALTVFVTFFVWGQGLNWQAARLSAYSLFPLFGLLAFSLMWGHYIVDAIRRYFDLRPELTKQYFEITSGVVLAAILLHPHILIWRLWKDGFGLPPNSYLAVYGAPGMKLALAIGTVSLGIFLIYELRRKFRNRSWWWSVQLASDIAILGIFYHGLTLGRHLQSGWFRGVWLFWGVSLLVSLIYIYYKKLSVKKHSPGSA